MGEGFLYKNIDLGGDKLVEILNILKKNSRYTNEEIAIMVGKTEQEVADIITDYEKRGVIAGYTTLINWNDTQRESVTALIEIKVAPQRGEGFDKVAERIYKFPEVSACYLMSGGFDLTVIVEGKSMEEVAYFVSQKLSIQEYVLSSNTHFILKRYKDNGKVFEKKLIDKREAIII